MKNIIVFGNDGVGKTTLAWVIYSLCLQEKKKLALPLSLASSLKSELSKELDLEFYTKPTSVFARSKMKERASERKINVPYFFCNEILRIIEILPEKSSVIIDDGRFLVEKIFFEKLEFFTVGITTESPILNEYAIEANEQALASQMRFESKNFRPYDAALKIIDACS